MSQEALAELSRVLYAPVTLLLYLSAACVYLYALTTTVGRPAERRRGRWALRVGGVLAALGVTAHVAHELVRGFAQERLPLGNMFEVTSLMALVGIVTGLVYLHLVRRRPELSGFVLVGGSLVMGMAMLMYAEPGPLMPILDTWWRSFHVSLLVSAMGVLSAGFVFTALHLLRERGERAVEGWRGPGGSTVGAAYIGDLAPAGVGGPEDELRRDPAHRTAMRAGVPAVRLAVGTFLGASLVSWVWLVDAGSTGAGIGRTLGVNLALVAAALLARWFVPYLPASETLDGLAHRTIAFGFVLWTVGTIAGAMWAEVSWGRFWGWDPKETGAFLTWVVYAGYLHGRATSGIRGRRAAWIGVGAFLVLMATYLIANYVVVGLHSYAEV